MVLTATVVLAAEMLNTVVEAAVDLASPAYHPLARIAKDVSAGAVLTTSLGAIAVGLLVYLPRLLSLLTEHGGELAGDNGCDYEDKQR